MQFKWQPELNDRVTQQPTIKIQI